LRKSKEETAAYHRDWYARNKERVKLQAKTYKKNRRQLIQASKNVPCTDCGIKYPPYVMDFDHLHDKVFTLGTNSGSKGVKATLEEIGKCEVVCANCHRERTHQRQAKGNS